ncbi:hypothetical protein ACHAXA_006496 [Cyclostephanos tholiformis]|uniref:Protein-tyrosine sulfotransferase n=1 Tax=Cyclostephanos tholiformis TaxID=382380 RepID=A0ABD3RZH3_9STRA
MRQKILWTVLILMIIYQMFVVGRVIGSYLLMFKRGDSLGVPPPLYLSHHGTGTPDREKSVVGSVVDASAHDCSGCDFVFIVATGRSGSTTLMTFLNSIPGVHVSGENDGQTERLRLIYESLRHVKREHTRHAAWANTYNMNEIKRDMRKMLIHVINPPAGSDTIGFKEMRFHGKDLDFIRMLFPRAKFILSIRGDVSKQPKSAFNRGKNSTRVKAALKKENEILSSLSRKHPDYMYLVKLEDFSVKKFDDILRFLGRTDCKTLRVPALNTHGGYTKMKKLRNKLSGVVKCNKRELAHEG